MNATSTASTVSPGVRAPVLGRFSLGVGDRFGRQGVAQIAAIAAARADNIVVTPVWNKSNREHALIGTCPADARRAADDAVRVSGWPHAYLLDADHVGLATVDRFVDACDFFTLDVADFIGGEADEDRCAALVARVRACFGDAPILPGLGTTLSLSTASMMDAARSFLAAAEEAGRIHRHIAERRQGRPFVVEVSMDEADRPQTPAALLVILTALAQENIPVQTLAPRFCGRFNKGVDYVGDPRAFAREFEQDVAVLALARGPLGLPDDIKLSVHSGSDKFSIYGPIRDILVRHGAGLHLKTAGTTWLEELVGLALGEGEALAFVKSLWGHALARREELAKPYATVIDIDPDGLPSADDVNGWTGARMAAAIRHDPDSPAFNPNMRQLLHVSFRLAAEAGGAYLSLLDAHRDGIAHEVATNLLDRHIRRVFPAESPR